MQALFTPDHLYQGIITIGAVITGLKVTMNGLHKSQKRLEQGVSKIQETQVSHGNRLTRVETKLEILPQQE